MLRMHSFEEMGKRGRKRLAIFPPVLASFGLCDGGNSRCIHFLFRGRRVTQTQSSARSFFREGSMQQMNDWSRLAVDPARCKKLCPFVPHKTMVGQERKDNSVYPLTTTYHE
jgi:hypothetical protein